jgi:cardiolipin synthase A/B
MNEVSYRFYTKTSDAWEAMLVDLENAKTSIDFERYIFCCDTVGSRFIETFKRKAKEGVIVRVLTDMVGSFGFYFSPVVKELEAAGVQVKFFNPISPWRIANFTSTFFRDHRKLIIIDNAKAYVGGIGIDAKTADWRDTEVRLEGPIVSELKRLFDRLWLSTLRQKFLTFLKTPFFIKHYEILTNSPRLRQRFIYRAFIENIRLAQKYIYLTTPYFIPDLRFLRVLRLAAKRGVDVRILVPRTSDHAFIDNSTRSYFTLALNAGIKIYLYEPHMLHAKTAVIDDTWSTVGTFNLDNLSFRYNYELNVVSTKSDFIKELHAQFFTDLESSARVHYESWIKRPLLQKFREFITWPFHDIF